MKSGNPTLPTALAPYRSSAQRNQLPGPTNRTTEGPRGARQAEGGGDMPASARLTSLPSSGAPSDVDKRTAK